MEKFEKFVISSRATYYETLPNADKPVSNTNRAFGAIIKSAVLAGIACSIAVSAPSEAHAQNFLSRLLGGNSEQTYQQPNPYYQQGYQQGPQQGWGNQQPRYVQQQYRGQEQYIQKTPAATEVDRMVDQNAERLREAGSAFRRQGAPVCFHIVAVPDRIIGKFYSVQSDDCRAVEANNRQADSQQGQYQSQRTMEDHQRQAAAAGIRYDPELDSGFLKHIVVYDIRQASDIQHQLNQETVNRIGR